MMVGIVAFVNQIITGHNVIITVRMMLIMTTILSVLDAMDMGYVLYSIEILYTNPLDVNARETRSFNGLVIGNYVWVPLLVQKYFVKIV